MFVFNQRRKRRIGIGEKAFDPSLTKYLWKEFIKITLLLVYLMNNINGKEQGNQNIGKSKTQHDNGKQQ